MHRFVQRFKVIYMTAGRDIKAATFLLRAKVFIGLAQFRNDTVADMFKRVAKKYPHKVAFYCENEVWTYSEVDQFSNKVANCFKNLGYKAGDEVALFMESTPRQIATWLGLSKVGVVPALVNTSLKHKSLLHSVTVINAKAFIFDSEYFPVVNDAIPLINETVKLDYFAFGALDKNLLSESPVEVRSLKKMIAKASADPVNYKGNFSDRLFYIYTSGTTGLPKAAIIKNSRYVVLSTGTNLAMQLGKDDVLYTPLPLYHMAAAILGVSQSVLFGVSVALRPKFSSSKFWEDCVHYKCTAAQYIGELCRYLLNHSESQNDRKHNVRVMFGNGLKPSIWPAFQRRFGIKKIVEVYGATESNATVLNLVGKEGACGFIPQAFPRWFLRLAYPVALVKADEVTGEIIRGKNGVCELIYSNGSGIFIGKIKNDPIHQFEGYVNKVDTKKKVIKDVFRKGDSAFVSGDVLTVDELGYLYFKDRIGDTFRWKGENIATTEVESIISEATNLSDCVVFGVNVPNCEGKAGMAGIYSPNLKFDSNDLLKKLNEDLPPYAIPLFIRILSGIETTGTLKLPKTTLQQEGYDVRLVKDDLYYLNPRSRSYEKLDIKSYEAIMNGKIKF